MRHGGKAGQWLIGAGALLLSCHVVTDPVPSNEPDPSVGSGARGSDDDAGSGAAQSGDSGEQSSSGSSSAGKSGKPNSGGRSAMSDAGAGGEGAGAGSEGDGGSGASDGSGASNGSGAAGAAGAAGAPGDVDECDVDEGCPSQCKQKSATCTVAPLDFACEFMALVGESAQLECGGLASVGTACCGGCGCVDVKLYFDGQHCWQGIPDCALSNFVGKLFLQP